MTWQFDTRAIHSGYQPDTDTGATNVPLYQSAGFTHDPDTLEAIFNGRQPGFYYSRTGNPTVAALENRLTALENARGTVCVSSGMAAIMTVIMALAQSGDTIIVSTSLFGSTYYLMNGVVDAMGIRVVYVDPREYDAYHAAVNDRTKLIFLEAIGNPKLDVPDLEIIGSIAKQHAIPLVVDTTFVTPYLLNAKAYNIGVVTIATTKYLCGGGLAIGGAVVDTGVIDWDKHDSPVLNKTKKLGELAGIAAFKKVRGTTGNSLAVNNAFLTLKGIETLPLRMDRHSQNALLLAQHIRAHYDTVGVTYPGLSDHPDHAIAMRQFNNQCSGMLTLRLGTQKRAYDFLNALKLIQCLVNLGDAKTLMVCPRYTIYRELTDEQAAAAGVYSDLIRVSVGLESITDIMQDIDQAMRTLA